MILFIFFIFVSAIFYVLNVFYKKTHPDASFFYVFMIGLLFALIQNVIRIPTLYYYGKNIDSITTFAVINLSSLLAFVLYSKYVLQEKTYIISYIIISIIVSLIIFNNYIVAKLKGKTK